MSQGLVIGQYYPSGSPVHSVDPRVKIALVTLFTIAVLFIANFSGLVAVAAIIAGLLVVARIPIGVTARGLRPLLFILFIAFAIQVLSGGGPWIGIGLLRLSEPGLQMGAFIALRLLLLVAGASLLTLTTTPVELGDAIESLILPLNRIGVPSHEIAMMMMIALRFIPTLAAETDKIVKAQAARGARFNTGNLWQRIRSAIPVLIPLFINIFRRSDELAEAMEARAYRGGEGRTRIKELILKPMDVIVFVAGLAVLGLIVWIGRLPLF